MTNRHTQDDDDDDIDYGDVPEDSGALLSMAATNTTGNDYDRAMHRVFGTSQYIVTKETDLDNRGADEKHILPLAVPEGTDVTEVRPEYEIEQQRSRLKILAAFGATSLHVRHGDTMKEWFQLCKQTL